MKHILLIGLGSIGRRHLSNLSARFPGARFTVLRHSRHSTQQPDPLCEQLGARVISDLTKVLAEEVDLAVVATPSANHIDTLPELIARGWNLLVEKPIVTTVADCNRIEALLAKAPPAIRVSGFNFRYLSSLQQMRRLIRENVTGKVVRASFTAGLWLPDWRPAQDWRNGYSADASRGGGVEMDLVHEIDVARWFFGDLRLEFALGGRYSSLDLGANDVSTMVFSAGGTAPIIQITLDYVARKRLRHYEVIGDRTGLLWNIDGRLEEIVAGDIRLRSGQPADFDITQTYIDMIDCLALAIGGDWRDPLQSLEDGLTSTRLAIAARDEGTRK